VVRRYLVAQGRTGPAPGVGIGLIDVVVAAPGARAAPDARIGPEHRQLLAACHEPSTAIDLASQISLPVGVVQVLLGDLREYGLVRVTPAATRPFTDTRLLRQVLDGLRAL
jgi:hypothetical protein